MRRRVFTREELDEILLLLDGSRYGDMTALAKRFRRSRWVIYAKISELRARGLSFAERRRLAEMKKSRAEALSAADLIGRRVA